MANYILLERITVGAAGAASVTFNNIPQTGYTDLKIMFSARTNASGVYENVIVKPNGATTNLSDKTLYTINGTSAASAGDPTQLIIGQAATASETANVFGNSECYIPNYTSSNYKSFSSDGVNENNATAATLMMIAGLWQSTAAITSLVIAPSIGTSFTQYSTFSLYGLAAVGATPAIDPKATGGDIIQTDGTYWYHAFLSSGTFTPKVGLTCDVLVVAGGGGGTKDNGAGGSGGGGLVVQSGRSVSSTSYTVTVGAGGAAGTGSPGQGTNGGNSVFDTITALGGGLGGAPNGTFAATTGGSGGGGGYYGSMTGAAGTQTNSGGGTGYASAGGNGGPNTGNAGAGGGGGAVGVGAVGTSSVGGNGGIGFYNSLTDAMGAATNTGQLSGGHYYYAGGGGGAVITGNGSNQGVGGLGGGGQGGSYQTVVVNPVAGTPNTGGGAGGNGAISGTAVTGGSGIVIVRYTVA